MKFVKGRGWGLLTQLGSLQYQNSEGTRASDNPSLRGGGRVNVRIDSAGRESLLNIETVDLFIDVVGERCAGVGVDGEIMATSAVAIVYGSLGRLNKRDRKYISLPRTRWGIH